MTAVKLEPAARSADLGEYAKDLDARLAAPSERAGLSTGPVPDGAPAAPVGPEPLDPDAVEPLVAIVGAVATDRTGTSDLTPKERKELAGALAPVLDKYAGDLFAGYAEEVALAAALYVVAVPRIAEHQAAKSKASKAEADAAELAGGDDGA